MKQIVRCKDCPNWMHGIIRENYCQVFDWCSDGDDGCTFESADRPALPVSNYDAEPVRHGHWILEREPNGKPYCFHCSVCDDDFHYIDIKSATDYCPHCGAKMMDEVTE